MSLTDEQKQDHHAEPPFEHRVIAVHKRETDLQTEEYPTNLRLSRTVRSGDDRSVARHSRAEIA
jgi:hypothetical protein